jgi:homoserine O-acetyltransferase
MTPGSVGTTTTEFFAFGSPNDPFRLRSGEELREVTMAYETYGELTPDRDNAVLVFHALTGSQHAAGFNSSVPGVGGRWTEECQVGWWDRFIGPDKAIDTNRFFVITANYVGGCYGSTGPSSINPDTGEPYGSRFPKVGFCDIVDANVRLVQHLGIERLHAVIGASTGGIMCLSLATRYPDMVDIVIPIASGTRLTSLQTLHNFEQITAIQSDPAFADGDYYANLEQPVDGLALARMIGHKGFISLGFLKERALSETPEGDGPGTYHIENPLESYIWHQGSKFISRFDANSYLVNMHAWQTFDLGAEAGVGSFVELFERSKDHHYMVFSIDSDVCFYPEEQEELSSYLKAAGVRHRHVTVHSEKGHDSFLLEPRLYAPHLSDTLTNPWHD